MFCLYSCMGFDDDINNNNNHNNPNHNNHNNNMIIISVIIISVTLVTLWYELYLMKKKELLSVSLIFSVRWQQRRLAVNNQNGYSVV